MNPNINDPINDRRVYEDEPLFERDPNACDCDSGALRLPGKQCCAECARECHVCGGAS